eukprot:SAG11_NODE_288_length_11198_cov_29.339130_1_plen_366_part_10
MVTDPQARREQVYNIGKVKVDVMQARGLSLDDSTPRASDIYVVMSVNGKYGKQSRVTSDRGSPGNPRWETEEVYSLQVPSRDAVLEIALFRHATFGEDELIGVLLVAIAELRHEVLSHKWFALKTTAPPHDSQDLSHSSDLDVEALGALPHSVPELELGLLFIADKAALGELTVTVKAAKDLPQMDMLGSADPFCTLVLNPSQVAQTRVVEDSQAPEWSESFTFKVEELMSDCVISMYDFDSIGTNEPMGRVTINIGLLVPGRTYEQWHTLQKMAGMEIAVQGSLQLSVRFDLVTVGGPDEDEHGSPAEDLENEWEQLWELGSTDVSAERTSAMHHHASVNDDTDDPEKSTADSLDDPEPQPQPEP